MLWVSAPIHLHPPQTRETKTKLGHGYKFNHYIIIYNSEVGQLKEASLDSFRLSCLRTLPKPGIHFNIQSIHRCARPSRSWKCATNTFTRSTFHKDATVVTRARILWWRLPRRKLLHFGRNQESNRYVDDSKTGRKMDRQRQEEQVGDIYSSLCPWKDQNQQWDSPPDTARVEPLGRRPPLVYITVQKLLKTRQWLTSLHLATIIFTLSSLPLCFGAIKYCQGTFHWSTTLQLARYVNY